MPASRLVKSLLQIFAVLVCIVIVTLYLHRPRPKAPFRNLTASAEQVTLQAGPAHVRLNYASDGWTVSLDSAAPTFPADKSKVSSMLESLEDLRIEDEISDRPDRLASFEADDQKGLDVALFGKNGSHLAEGIFGKQAPDFGHIYFRYPGKPEVYLARGVVLGELGGTDLNGWRSRELLTLPENQVQAIFIEGPGFKTPMVRSSDTWSANGILLDPGKVFAFIGALSHLRADDFVNPAQYPQLTANKLTYAMIAIQTNTGNHVLHLGRMDPIIKRFPVSVDSQPNVAWLNEPTGEALLKKVSDFNK